MIGVLVSGAGTNLQALLDAGLPVVAVASNKRDAAALDRARCATASFELADFPDRARAQRGVSRWTRPCVLRQTLVIRVTLRR